MLSRKTHQSDTAIVSLCQMFSTGMLVYTVIKVKWMLWIVYNKPWGFDGTLQDIYHYLMCSVVLYCIILISISDFSGQTSG